MGSYKKSYELHIFNIAETALYLEVDVICVCFLQESWGLKLKGLWEPVWRGLCKRSRADRKHRVGVRVRAVARWRTGLGWQRGFQVLSWESRTTTRVKLRVLLNQLKLLNMRLRVLLDEHTGNTIFCDSRGSQGQHIWWRQCGNNMFYIVWAFSLMSFHAGMRLQKR